MSNDLSSYTIDQRATFEGLAFLQSEPKMKFGTTQQETTRDGIPKWELQVHAGSRDPFGKVRHSIIKVGVAAHRDPGADLAMYTPIQLQNLEIGVMEKTKKNPATGEEKVIGVNVWFRAAGIVDLLNAKAPKTTAA